jgi:hypothetical protein
MNSNPSLRNILQLPVVTLRKINGTFPVSRSRETLDAWELAVRKVYEQHVLRLQKQAAMSDGQVAGSQR